MQYIEEELPTLAVKDEKEGIRIECSETSKILGKLTKPQQRVCREIYSIEKHFTQKKA